MAPRVGKRRRDNGSKGGKRLAAERLELGAARAERLRAVLEVWRLPRDARPPSTLYKTSGRRGSLTLIGPPQLSQARLRAKGAAHLGPVHGAEGTERARVQ